MSEKHYYSIFYIKKKALGYLLFGLLTSDEFQLGRRFRSFIYTAASRSRRQAKRDNHRTHQKVTGTFFFLSLSLLIRLHW